MLIAGSKLGPYEILSPLGAGGMGEVYRARDSKLNREVALKVLPTAFASDADRMARFQREAQLLASLNHPNIASIYGLEESGGVRALVMELVEGPTLAERITRIVAPLQLDEALSIAKQIAEALEFAHERGIIHRDLKPANIKITPEGAVKVLDFGLAKALEDPVTAGDPANSPTISIASTRAGVIMGTAAYMSPEQARGHAVDRRSDIWSFGVVLFEMLAGCQAFEGETISDVLASVLKFDPDWNALPSTTPPSITKLLRRCLTKDRKKRLQSIGEARIAIEETLSGTSDVGAIHELPLPGTAVRTPPLQRALPWAVAAVFLLTTIIAILAHFREPSTPARPVRSYILPPEKTAFEFLGATGGPVLSPDGTRVVFPARDASGKVMLWVRRLDSLSAQPLEGTEGASYPFWSPNSRFLGFFVPGKLKKIDVSGGPPQTVCDALSGRGGTWNADNIIVFAPDLTTPLLRVSAAGGAAAPLTQLDKSRRETSNRWPFFLPDGRHFVYWAGIAGSVVNGGVLLGSLDGGERRFLFQAASGALYAPPGYLLYLREQSLMAQPFDAGSLKLTGDAFPIAEQVISPLTLRLGFFSASQNGVLVYLTGSGAQTQLAWLDANGKQLAAVGEPGGYNNPRLSPDGSRLAESVGDPQARNANIWLIDLARGVRTRFTFDEGTDIFPVWSPHGTRIVFGSNLKGSPDLYVKNASGAGAAEPLLVSDAVKLTSDWSRDGRYIAFSYLDYKGQTKFDIWVLPMFGDRKPFPFLQTEFNEGSAVFSPDGHWLAYQSDESGRFEIYVAPFQGQPATSTAGPQALLSQGVGGQGGKWQVSQGGGRGPTWRRDGKALYYLGPEGTLMEAAVMPKGTAVEVGIPRQVLRARFSAAGSYSRPYDVAPDGKRFLVLTSEETSSTTPLTLVTNWTAGLKKK
ncbi:MAG: protein kinase domain-containing protein [Terriglobia bacterium]